MTDPGAAERLAALRSTRNAPKVPHAQAAKILTAGVSTSMVLGIVSYMAHSANVEAAAKARDAQRLAASQALAQQVLKATPATSTTAAVTTVPAGAAGPTPTAAKPPKVVVVPVPQPAPSKPATTSRSSK